MNVPLEDYAAIDKNVPMRELVTNLQQTLARNHQKILAAALSDWQRKYEGRDPSDACASVRIAPPAPPTRKSKASFQKLVRRSRTAAGGRGSGPRDN